MAITICNLVANGHHRHEMTDKNDIVGGLVYGYTVDEYGNQYRRTAYALFDVTALIHVGVSTVYLVRDRASLTSMSYGVSETGIKINYQYFTSTVTDTISIPAITLVPGTANLLPDTRQLGIIRELVAFDVTKQLNGYIGIVLTADATQDGIAVDSNMYLEVTTSPIQALAPINLLPNTVQNPRGEITLSWWHVPNPSSPNDPQVGAQVITSQNGISKTFDINDISNALILPPNTFTTYENVSFTVRTKTEHNGYSAMSAPQTFALGKTPPLQSVLVFPLNIALPANMGVDLNWLYNSPHDTTPSRFDIRYRIDYVPLGDNETDEQAWADGTLLTNSGQLIATTGVILTQSTVDWQIKAYGELGDAGPWSKIGTFFTIGAPKAPTIIGVSNSNRPRVSFSAQNLMSWQMVITRGNDAVYDTGNTLFTNSFEHLVNMFLPNGNYIISMQIKNEFGLVSPWAMLPFTINTTPPEPLTLKIVDNPRFNARLHFNNIGEIVYIYRSELEKENYLRIAVTRDNIFDDFTVRPKQRYKYFVRVVNAENNYADSNIEVISLNFKQTTIAVEKTPSDMLMLMFNKGSQPTKDLSFDYEKTLTNYLGREKPVSQIGDHSSKSVSLAFFCTFAEYERLENMHRLSGTLILRDARFDTIYGTINGDISCGKERNGWNVSFTFTETDHKQEVDLL